MPPPSLVLRLSTERQRLVFGLQATLYTDISLFVLALMIDPEVRGDLWPGAILFGAFLVFTWWWVVPAWIELRPPGRHTRPAYLLTSAANLLLTAALVTAVFARFAVAVALAALAFACLVARIVVGLRSRAEQRREGTYDARRRPRSLAG